MSGWSEVPVTVTFSPKNSFFMGTHLSLSLSNLFSSVLASLLIHRGTICLSLAHGPVRPLLQACPVSACSSEKAVELVYEPGHHPHTILYLRKFLVFFAGRQFDPGLDVKFICRGYTSLVPNLSRNLRCHCSTCSITRADSSAVKGSRDTALPRHFVSPTGTTGYACKAGPQLRQVI